MNFQLNKIILNYLKYGQDHNQLISSLGYCMYEVQSPEKQENSPLALFLALLAITSTFVHVYLKISVIFFVSF